MNDITLIRNEIYSLLPAYVIDCATFAGSGILANSFSTIWMNDPTTKSGIAIAGLLNATALGIANNIAKTDDKTPLLHKIVLTVATLALTAIATPYLVTVLRDRFFVILTSKEQLQIGGLNLAAKAITYALSCKMPTTPEDIANFSPAKLKEDYDFFKTTTSFRIPLTQTEGLRLAYHNAFFKNDLPFFGFDWIAIGKMPFSQNPEEIVNYTKHQPLWLHHILSSPNSPILSKEISQPYVDLFYTNDLAPLDKTLDNKDRILPDSFTLPIPQTPDDINKLTENQVKWHHLFTKNFSNWKSISLELQYALYKKFYLHNLSLWPLIPSQETEIENAPICIIGVLYRQQKNSSHQISSQLQEVLNKRLDEFILVAPKTFQDVQNLTDEEICKHHFSFAFLHNEFSTIPSDAMQIEWSKRFIALELLPPCHSWSCNCEVPTTPDEFCNLENFQILWLWNSFSTNNDSRKNLQILLVKLLLIFDLCEYVVNSSNFHCSDLEPPNSPNAILLIANAIDTG